MTTKTTVDLTPALSVVERYAAKLLTDVESSGSTDIEFSVANHFTWDTGTEFVSMTVLVTAQQPEAGRFTLRIEFDGNGSEVFGLAYGERIIDWIVDLLEKHGWEVPVTTDPTNLAQKARVSYDEGFVFFTRRPNAPSN